MTSPVQLYPERRHCSQLPQDVANSNGWTFRYLLEAERFPVLDHNWTLQIRAEVNIIHNKVNRMFAKWGTEQKWTLQVRTQASIVHKKVNRLFEKRIHN